MIEPNIVLESLSPGRSELVYNELRKSKKYETPVFDMPTSNAQLTYMLLRYFMRINGSIIADKPFLFDRGHIAAQVNFSCLMTNPRSLRHYVTREEMVNLRMRSEFVMFRPTVIVFLEDDYADNIRKEVHYLALLKVCKIPHIKVKLFNGEHWRGTKYIIEEIYNKVGAL